MRKKIKISFLLLLSFIGLIFVSCELQEETIHQHEHNSNLKLYEMKFEELMTNKKFVNSFSKLPKSKRSITNATFGRTVMENEYGFTIANKPAKVIENNGETSYTFLISRDSTISDSFENLVIQTDSLNNTKAVIIKYNLTSPIIRTEDNSYSFDAEEEITPIVFDNTTVSESSKQTIICYSLITLVCNYGGSEHVAGMNCTLSYTYNTYKEDCITVGLPDYDSGGGGGSSGGNDSTYDGSDPNIHGNGSNSVNTAPVVPEIEEIIEDPCESLKNGTSSIAYKQKFKDLTSNYNLPHETGFVEKEVSGLNQYVDMVPDAVNAVQPPSGSKNATHVHQNLPKISEDGIAYDGRVKIHSIGDLESLIGPLQRNNSTTPKDTFVLMLSNEAIYAITILEPFSLSPLQEQTLVEIKKII